jgi:LacI family transcriptional regulator
MQNRRSTLKEVADALGLSVPTVSRALGGHSDIALRTRERVAAKARELGYVPNSAGRMLVSGRSGFVGLVLPIHGRTFVDSYLGEFVTGLAEGLVSKGMDLFIATAPEGHSELAVLRHVVDSGRADGVVLIRTAEDDERIRFLSQRRFPFVSHGRVREPKEPHHWLDSAGEHAFAQAFEILYDLGHRHIGLVTIDDPMTFRHIREEGLASAIARRGDPSVRLTVVRSPRFDSAARGRSIHQLIATDDRPTAVIGLFDEIALAVLEEAARLGLSVPNDLSVIGFDNLVASAFAPPGLTTFDQATRESARTIARMIHQVISDPPARSVTHLMEPTLIARGSHGPAPETST